jgi:AcrR family transcriptional regulator
MNTQPDLTRADTRTRLLEAAGETFADLGFRNTTVREICRRAGANIAAVHYHFGGKEELYLAVLTHSAAASMERNPLGGAPAPGATAEDRLESFVTSFLERLLDEGRPAWFGKLMAREMFEPTRGLDRIAQEFARPQYGRLSEIVAELLGPAATETRVKLCCSSVLGQCLFYKHARPMIDRLMPGQAFEPEQRAALAAHITEFSLRAIRSMRESAATGRGG